MDKFSPQQAFAQKLKDVLELIVDSIFHILSAAKMVVKDTAERERLQVSAHAASVIAGAQALLKMITELKLSVLTSNLEGLNQLVDEQNAVFQTGRQSAVHKAKKLEHVVDVRLKQLEDHYYSSVYR